jgi:Polyketide cyclase / dehydrase and lipid transport
MKLERSVIIGRPVEEVFELAGNPDSDLQWGSLITESRQISPGPLGKGTTFLQTASFLGGRITSSLEITEYEPEKLMCFRANEPIVLEHCRRFEPAPEGTLLTFFIDAQVAGRFKVAGPIFLRIAERQLQGDLESLKDLLESTDPAGS